MTCSARFKNLILDCLEDVIFATPGDICLEMMPKIFRRPNLDTVQRALHELEDDGLIECCSHPPGQRKGWNRRYRMTRTRPIQGSLRKAA